MQTKNIKLNRLAEKNLLDIFSCPLVSGFMIDSELSKDFFNQTKQFFILGYSAEPQQELDMLNMITESMAEIESDFKNGHSYECESLYARNIISMNVINSIATMFFKGHSFKRSGKLLKELTEMLKEIMATMLNHTIKTGQINMQDYQKHKNENLKSMQDAREMLEKERLNK